MNKNINKKINLYSNIEVCHYCMNEPNSHSFFLDNNNIDDNPLFSTLKKHTYKTKIANAKLYDKPDTIIYHIEIELKRNKTVNVDIWNWIIDFSDTKMKHYMAFTTVHELSKWINSEKDGLCKNLENIKIKNAGIMIKPLISLAKWFLPEHIKVECL